MLHSTLAATHTEPMAQPYTQLQQGLCPCCQSPHARDFMWVLQRWPVSECDLIIMHHTVQQEGPWGQSQYLTTAHVQVDLASPLLP